VVDQLPEQSLTIKGIDSSAVNPQNSSAPNSTEIASSGLADVLDLARSIRNRLRSEVADYTARLVKRERIGGKLGAEEHVLVKIRNPTESLSERRPLSAYLRFVPPGPSAGREVIWVDGLNDGKLQTYQFGLRVSLDPNGRLAMMGNKYPITEIGLLRLCEKLIEKGQRDEDVSGVRVLQRDNQVVGDRSCRLIQVVHSTPQPGLDFHIAEIFIDQELQLPIRYAAYLWPSTAEATPPLLEEYTYFDLKINTGLTDSDFDPDNPSYGFP
jgi:hypothetical protein